MNVEGQKPSHYSLRHHATAWVSQTLFDRFSYTVQHGLLKGMKRKGGLGWIPQSLWSPMETPEDGFWKALDMHGQVVYDVGAFHGLLTLFFARQCRQVVCYEPNTKNNARILENLLLNGLTNVTVRKLALGAETGVGDLICTPLMPGTGSLETNIVEALKRSDAPKTSEQVQISTLDRDVAENGLPAPDFIKIDVEGLELEVLRGARNILEQCRPALFLEMHGATMDEKRRKVSEIVAWLEQNGYRRIMHVESGSSISSSNPTIAAEGHLYCLHEMA